MSDKEIDLSCKDDCGQVLSAFLREMAEHNAKVVCPQGGSVHDPDEFAEAVNDRPPVPA